MTQIHKSRTSNNPYIAIIWQTRNITDGVYLATPDGSWDLIMGIGTNGERYMMLTGQATKPANIPYQAGTSSVVICFTAGAYLPHLAGKTLLDSAEILSNVDDDHFSLDGHTFPFPTFENAEKLVEQMVQLGILKNNDIIDSVLQGTPKAMSKRAVQRHFVRTTGLTQKSLQQIKRAQQAVKLLKAGKKPVEAAADAGYTDQPHLAKSLKRIMDSAPSDVDDIHKL